MAEKTRKLWLDWQRGLAVLYMVQWHTYDSWRADAVAHGPVHTFLGHVGGFAAPSFLYMAGMSQLLGDGALERKAVDGFTATANEAVAQADLVVLAAPDLSHTLQWSIDLNGLVFQSAIELRLRHAVTTARSNCHNL